MMGRAIYVSLLVAASFVGATTATAATPWKPGTPYKVLEEEAVGLLEQQTYDHAYCVGVSRFGTHGDFPNRLFLVFDCDVRIRGKVACYDQRWRSVRGKRRDTFQLRLISMGDC